MTVYVDTIVIYPNARRPFHNGSCHMTADSLDELHAFAARLGLKRAWFQNHPLAPHYDLTELVRTRAVLAGAKEETCREGALRRRAARQAAEGGAP